jgi:hypothetical protein
MNADRAHEWPQRQKLPDLAHVVFPGQFATSHSAGALSAVADFVLPQRFVMLTLTPSTFFMSSYEQNAIATPGMTCASAAQTSTVYALKRHVRIWHALKFQQALQRAHPQELW